MREADRKTDDTNFEDRIKIKIGKVERYPVRFHPLICEILRNDATVKSSLTKMQDTTRIGCDSTLLE